MRRNSGISQRDANSDRSEWLRQVYGIGRMGRVWHSEHRIRNLAYRSVMYHLAHQFIDWTVRGGRASDRDLIAKADVDRNMMYRALAAAVKGGHLKVNGHGGNRWVVPILKREAGLPERKLVELKVPIADEDIPF